MIAYYLDGKDLSTLNIRVSSSTGVIDIPKMKAPPEQSWNEYHGKSVDLRKKRYEPREITLSCFIKAENNLQLVSRVNEIYAILSKSGTTQLRIHIDELNPLVYQVYCQDKIEIKKQWRENGVVYGTFDLKLIEPEIRKVVIAFSTTFVNLDKTITVNSDDYVTIYWGDYTDGIEVTRGEHFHIFPPNTRLRSYAIVYTTDVDSISADEGEIIWKV